MTDPSGSRSDVTSARASAAHDELWVWEAFRSLPLAGPGLHAWLADYFHASGLLAPAGDTLEIGGGDGHLWQVGGDALLDRVLAAGALHVTDADPDLVARCRSLPHLQRPGVVVAAADATRLPYADGRFARIIATHVLHWCATPAALRQALAEIARVLRPGGRAAIVTVDEIVHMTELYALLRRAKDSLVGRGVAVAAVIPDRAPRVLPFCAGNASGYLGERFAVVRRIDCDYAHRVEAGRLVHGVPGPDFLDRYVRTLPFVKEAVARQQLPEAFFAEVGARVRAELDARGVFAMSRRDVLYECVGPR